MIYKELDPFQSEDKFAKSGRAAEEQMAFYLKRFFGNDPDFVVLNGIRLEFEGDAAQIDHLVIHSFGLSIVESKSVHGKVQIKDDGQWIRWFGANQSKGMASPITQARLQEKFFRSVLGKASKQEALFAQLPIELFVAISNDGVILWPQSGQVAGVCKADQVADKIIESHQRKSKNPATLVLSPANQEKIAAYLVAVNKPLAKPHVACVETKAPEAVYREVSAYDSLIPKQPSMGNSCKYCGSPTLEVRFGHTYYFYCTKCEKNSPIKITCPTCGEAPKLRKQRKEFFAECGKCSTSKLYFTNP